MRQTLALAPQARVYSISVPTPPLPNTGGCFSDIDLAHRDPAGPIRTQKMDHIRNPNVPNVEPDIAVSDFMKERKDEVSASTHRNYKYTLELLIEWCENNDVEYVNETDGYKLKRWKLWRQEQAIGKVTLKNNISTIRTFLQWCEDAELLPPNLHDKLSLPDLSEKEQSNDTMLSPERVKHTRLLRKVRVRDHTARSIRIHLAYLFSNGDRSCH